MGRDMSLVGDAGRFHTDEALLNLVRKPAILAALPNARRAGVGRGNQVTTDGNG